MNPAKSIIQNILKTIILNYITITNYNIYSLILKQTYANSIIDLYKYPILQI